MKNTFVNFIQKNGFVVLDGAMATELEARGANLNHSFWSAPAVKKEHLRPGERNSIEGKLGQAKTA